jgi:hypothetical protein
MPPKASSVLVKEVPMPSLLVLEDTLERHPDARIPLLESEIARRECEIVLLRSHRLLLRLQLWSAVQTALIAGLVIFSFGAALSGLVQVSKVVQRVGSWNATLTGNVLTRGLQREVQDLIPTSTVLEIGNFIPFWDLGDATRLSVVVAIVILALRVVQGVTHWRASGRLKQGARAIEAELGVLRQWLKRK